jgi:hypothetical protein
MATNNFSSDQERESQVSAIEQKLIALHGKLSKTSPGVHQNRIADDISVEMFRYQSLTKRPYTYKPHGNK